MRSFEFHFRPSRETVTVRVGRGALAAIAADVASEVRGGQVVVVSDDHVASLYGDPVRDRLSSHGLDAHLISFPRGEAHKTRDAKDRLEDRLLALGAGRDTALVAVGGGVTTDLAGFLAATWHRGVPLFLVPTTLLAMVDAAIGGKTGVDVADAKNAVGAFWQPRGVYVDPAVLDTLPDDEFRNGLAEVVKSAVVADASVFARLESDADAILENDAGVIEEVVDACARIKGAIVTRDPRESGPRAALNFGHTVGHAIEAASGYAVAHGQAVSAGMVVESALAQEHHGLPAEDRDRLIALLDAFGLPTRVPGVVATEAIEAAAARDKKNRGGVVRFALPVAIGRMPDGPDVTVSVPTGALHTALCRVRGEGTPD